MKRGPRHYQTLNLPLTVKEWQRLSTNLTQVSQGARLRDIPKQPLYQRNQIFSETEKKGKWDSKQ